jgi:tRNA-dihydrouridine synthase 4
LQEDKDTVELVRRLEAARVSWITVHGRTVTGQKDPVSLAHIKLVKESVGVPVVANGDICSEEDVARTRAATGVDGVMAARGLLANPAMFSGATTTTPEVVRDYVSHAIDTGTPFTCMHHHIMVIQS